MSESRTQLRSPSSSAEPQTSPRNEVNALELRIAELTGVTEFLAQKIVLSQSHLERLEREIEDMRRLRAQSENELQAQEHANTGKRLEAQELEAEIRRNEATIHSQHERIRTLAETIDIADKRSRQVIESIQADTNDRMKGIVQEYESERERLRIALDIQKTECEADIKRFTDEMQQNRKRQLRNLEIETQEAKKRAEDEVAKILIEGRQRSEALIKAAELTAQELARESEASARRLLGEANQKAADIIRAAQHEAEDVRRRTHVAEVNFLHEKNQGLAEMKLILNKAKDDAQAIVAAANKEASDLRYQAEKDAETKVATANQRIAQLAKVAERESQDYLERGRAELTRTAREFDHQQALKRKEFEETVAQERRRMEEEVRSVLHSARERAQAIIEAANHEKAFRIEEIKAAENSMAHSARLSAMQSAQEAEKLAIKIVDDARQRAAHVDKNVQSILDQAHAEASTIKAAAEAYRERVKREVPDPALWDGEVARMRREEQERFHTLIEPTVKNYLRAIDIAIADIFIQLPTKYHNNKVIQEFAQAIAQIQHRKNLVNFSEIVPRLAAQTNPPSAGPNDIKKSS